jgi:hypothetical protein
MARADGTRRWHATHDTRPLRALTDWLDRSGRRSLGAQMSGPVPPVGADRAGLGDAPFDPAGTLVERDPRHANLWIHGRPRLRTLFADPPEAGARARQEPADPLAGGDAYAGSTHAAPPRALNRASARGGEERLSAAILHRKLSAGLSAGPSPTDPAHLAEHCESGREWAAIAAAQARGDGFAHPHAARYDGWRQLVDPGLMGPGHPGMTGEW